MADLRTVQDSVNAFVQNYFFQNLLNSMGAYADDLAQKIRDDITASLDDFFVDLVGTGAIGEDYAPRWLTDLGLDWAPLSPLYLKNQKDYYINYFQYSSLPRREATRKRRLRRKFNGTQREMANSLQSRLLKLGNPSKYFGKVQVTVDCTQITGLGRYPAGTVLNGVKVGGRFTRMRKGDAIKIIVDWLPALDGTNVLIRDAVERFLPGQGSWNVAAKLTNNDKGPYRPLVSAYILWYQKNMIFPIINRAIQPYL